MSRRVIQLEEDPISVAVQFDREKIDSTRDYEGHLMVTVKADDDEEMQRTPVCCVLVLDRSGSMDWPSDGEIGTVDPKTKMESLKDVTRKLVENLKPGDQIAVVTYSENVEVLVARVDAKNKQSILSSIDGLQPDAATNLSAGLLEGIRQIDETFDGVKRVMLLTDGLANRGITGPSLVDLVRDRDSDCTISTFGFGPDADGDLLQEMAKAGGGNHYHIVGNKDIGNVFARELGGITSCVAQNIEVEVEPASGIEIIKSLNDFRTEQKGNSLVVKADDIYAGETKHILIKMTVAKPDGSPKNLLSPLANVRVSYHEAKSGRREHVDFDLDIRFTKPEDSDQKPVLVIQEQVAMLEAAHAQKKAVKLANTGDWKGAKRLIGSARKGLRAAHSLGSMMAGNCLESNSMEVDSYTVVSYSADFGQQVSSAASGAMRSRATSRSGFSDQFMARGAAEMEVNFGVADATQTNITKTTKTIKKK